MRILFVSHRVPYPPAEGGKIRAYNIIKHLTDSGHDVTVASLARSEREARDAAPLGQRVSKLLLARVGTIGSAAKMIRRLPTAEPSSMGYFWSAELAGAIARHVERDGVDLVLAHSSSVAPYVLDLPVPKVMDFCDMDSQKWLLYSRHKPWPLSWGYRLEGTKLVRAERAIADRFDIATCATPAEAEFLESLGARAATAWFPNGVDTDYFSPDGSLPDAATAAFVGRMDYFPNVQAAVFYATEVLPRVRRRFPDARFIVIGANPAKAVKRLERLPGVVVTGRVDDVRPYLRKAVLSVAPLTIARGTQNKILESMALGVPVVASPEAAKGVDAEPGVHLLTASGVDEWVEATELLFGAADRRAELVRVGRERMLGHHSWPLAMARLDQILAPYLRPARRAAG